MRKQCPQCGARFGRGSAAPCPSKIGRPWYERFWRCVVCTSCGACFRIRMRLVGWIGLGVAAAGIIPLSRFFDPIGRSALAGGTHYWLVIDPVVRGVVSGLIFGLIIRWGLAYEPYREA